MKTSAQHMYQRIVSVDYFSHLLTKQGEVISLPADTLFIHAGEIIKYCYIVKQGMVTSLEIFPNGKIRQGIMIAENGIVGEEILFLGIPSPTAFITIMPTELIRIKRDVLMSYLVENPSLYKSFIESLSKKVISGSYEISQLLCHSVTWRLCNLLLIFQTHYGTVCDDGSICIDIPLSQQKIARLLCVNRITVVHIMKTLQSIRLITRKKKKYYISDLDALYAYMEQCDSSIVP